MKAAVGWGEPEANPTQKHLKNVGVRLRLTTNLQLSKSFQLVNCGLFMDRSLRSLLQTINH
jgi:hypothetical protein